MSQFSDFLKQNDEQQAAKADAAAAAQEAKVLEAKRRSAVFTEKVEQIVRPAFMSFAEDMQKSGRAAKVEDGIDGMRSPYIDVTFFYDMSKGQLATERSTFRVKLNPVGIIEYTPFADQRKVQKDGATSSTGYVDDIHIEDLNARLLDFLKAVVASRS
ncbi:hypothetical protein [Paraburkholderia sp. Ac-20347]|uniref:hypothetical protein n=1 Tax=Paraburkholderia sp. Ac-20347 TaxID=2703892 RepID=UPI0019804FA4|nr:hypothetical protein [Paraburkholderia sp. Ac-20347]MBN3811697.1 hypothetical protein [Paraburkholderia sp. Ac-20347]